MRTNTMLILLIAAMPALLAGCETTGGTSGSTYTAENNPTALADRGAPDLDDPNRPAVWIRLDGREGHFFERQGRAQMQWVIDDPVSPAPTFRVDVFEPLLGSPKDLQLILQSRESTDGSTILYAVRAKAGTFEVGRDYPLLKPGDNFTIIDHLTRNTVDEIPPLGPGTYGIAAGISNAQTGSKGLAVTFFSVTDAE